MPECIGDPDEQNFTDGEGRDRRESEEYFLEMMAVANHLGILKNDVKSPSNHLTGLEQLIEYAFQYADPSITLNDLKAGVFDKMDWAIKVCECKSQRDYIGFVFISSGETDEELETKKEEFYKGMIIGIANSMLSRRITDDVRSSNGLSPLDQVIMFYFGYMHRDRLRRIKGDIYTLYKAWEGGSYIPDVEYSRLIKNFPKIFP